MTGIDARIKSLQEQLQFLGGDELIPGFRIQDFLNNEEKLDTSNHWILSNFSNLENTRDRSNEETVRARMLPKKRFDALEKHDRAEGQRTSNRRRQRNKFRTQGEYLALPAEETYTTRTGRGMEELTARDAMLRPDARAILDRGRPMSKDFLAQTTKVNAAKALENAFGDSAQGIKKLVANVWRAIAMDDKSFKYIKSGQKDVRSLRSTAFPS